MDYARIRREVGIALLALEHLQQSVAHQTFDGGRRDPTPAEQKVCAHLTLAVDHLRFLNAEAGKALVGMLAVGSELTDKDRAEAADAAGRN